MYFVKQCVSHKTIHGFIGMFSIKITIDSKYQIHGKHNLIPIFVIYTSKILTKELYKFLRM